MSVRTNRQKDTQSSAIIYSYTMCMYYYKYRLQRIFVLILIIKKTFEMLSKFQPVGT